MITLQIKNGSNHSMINRHHTHLDSKPWLCEEDDFSYASKDSNESSSLIKYSKIKMMEDRHANWSNYPRVDKESKEFERRENGRTEGNKFLSRACMVSRAEDFFQATKFRVNLYSSLPACE